MYLYRIEFYDLRDVLHDANIIADCGLRARSILQEFFPDAQIIHVLRYETEGCDAVRFYEDFSLALNAYKHGIYPEIKNR